MQTLPKDSKDRSFFFEEEQIGWIPSIIFSAVILVLTLAYFNEWGNNPLPLAAYIVSTAVLVLVLISFYKLQVKVSSKEIHLVYGIGVIRIKIEFDKILDAEVAKTSLYQGLGIRITSEGMLYNIHGTDAVKILYTRGALKSCVLIGSADPNSLREFLCKLSLFVVSTAILGCHGISERSDQALANLSPTEKKELKNILNNVYDKDQQYRAQAIAAIDKYGLGSEQVRTLAEAINHSDSVSLLVVKSIIQKHGWLGNEAVGEKANSALYLTIQHSDEGDRAHFLPIMREAVKNNLAKKQDLAHLEDRVADDQGRKQLYGTQVGFDEKEEKYYLLPLQDPENVDAMRTEMGLIPLRDYLSRWQIQYP